MKYAKALLVILSLSACQIFVSEDTPRFVAEDTPRFYTESKFCNLDSLLMESKRQDKPVLLYFTAYGSVWEKKIQQLVLSEYSIHTMMHEEFIPFALYHDDSESTVPPGYAVFNKRPENELWRYNVGLQMKLFKNRITPYFVILRSNGSIIVDQKYTEEIKVFKRFLKQGLREFDRS